MLRPQTHTIATAKQSCVCTEIYSYENAQKLLPPELLLLTQICTKSFVGWGFAPDPTGGAYSAPRPLAGIGGGAVGPPGKGEEGGKGKGGRGGEGRAGSPGMPKSRVGKPTCRVMVPSLKKGRRHDESHLSSVFCLLFFL